MVKCEHCHGEHDPSQRFCNTTGKLFAAERFFPPGMVLDGKYRLGALIGAGGMGAVIEGTHLLLDKRVAIKLLLPDFADNPEMSTRLLREARAASATGHRNIALVTDLGRTSEGTLYVVMERLTGRPLDSVLRDDAPLPVPRAARIVCDLLSGLDAVHRRGIVHRDLKPSNVMLCTEEDGSELVKILDFGISKEVGVRSDLTTMGRILGTPRFMPPEQARGLRDVDQRADIYAAGAILYTLLTSEPPVPGDNYNAVIAAILEGNIEPLSKKVPGIPARLDRIVMKAMARSREHRYPDALSFRKELSQFCREQPAATQRGVGQLADDRFDETAPPHRELSVSRLELVGLDERDPAPAGSAGQPWGTPRQQAPRVHAVEEAPPPSGVKLPLPAPLPTLRPAAAPVPADLRPGTPGVPQDFVAPEEHSAPLELAELPRREPPPTAPAPRGTVFHGSLPWQKLRKLAFFLLAVAAAGLGWMYRENLKALLTGAPSTDPSDQTIVLVDTDPSDAEVFVDGVFEPSKSVTLPKSTTRVYTLRVQAKGYVTEERQVIAERTQVLRVTLRRRH